MADEQDPREAARTAIYESIAAAAAELKDHHAPAQAEGLKNLAEAWAWLNSTNVAH